ncbi:MAG: hypothetical protein AB2559_21060 [Candidatus Thiodiazotropha endolucinida]
MNRKGRSKSKEFKITALPSVNLDPRLAEMVLPILLEGFGSQKGQSDSEYHVEDVSEKDTKQSKHHK